MVLPGICIIETLSYIPITMETPCVGVTSNYSPRQSSQHFKDMSSNAEHVLSATKLSIHVQLTVLYMVQST